MKLCVTAGPTRESIDPVRFIVNRSSGKMGYALAEVMLNEGHEVCLISGPVSLCSPEGVFLIHVETAEDMLHAVLDQVTQCDVLVMAAAVSDYTLVKGYSHKIKKSQDTLVLQLVKTQDVLKNVAQIDHNAFVVGFAAESENLIDNARQKLESKHLDMIVANNIITEGIGFGSDENAGCLLFADGTQQVLEKCAKLDFAKHVLKAICDRINIHVKLS